MRSIFDSDRTDAVILVDAANAFNRLNRQVALRNIRYICHPFSQVRSLEGTTQNDPLAMQFYALGTNPLLQHLRACVPEVQQVWLADDATGAAFIDKKLYINSYSLQLCGA